MWDLSQGHEPQTLGVSDLGFGVQSLIRVWGLGCRAQGLGFRKIRRSAEVLQAGLGFRVGSLA